MNSASDSSRLRRSGLLRNQLLFAAHDFEEESARRRLTPDRNKLVHNRIRRITELSGAVFLALNVATASVAGNFIVFNKILHWTF